MHTLRTFFAIELPSITLEQINKELFDLKNSIPRKIKWINIHSMHITIKFIGEFNPEHQPLIQKDLQSSLQNFGKIKVSLGKTGVFPNMRNPRVIWLGINDSGQLIDLARTVNLIASNYGYTREKRIFSPHLSIGRIRNNVSSRDREWIGQKIAQYKSAEIGPFITDRLSFIKSSLTPKGPIYSQLFEIPL
ncbi:MAG: RNA 2',3'-cyclic phosphodiesterase [Anaerolineaceae bacterium]|nr:RNA 2',3'-cyclic phosphodiesterase [Anaerolineaceae bacterium]